MRILSALSAAVFALSSVAAAAQQTPPKLLIVISVDQLSGDLFDEYRPHFTAGLKRLAGGAAFPNGYQSHATTETCPGHSTILTGDHPARTGIVSNAWADWAVRRADKTIYCAEDETAPGTDSDHYKLSPIHLRVPTLGDLLKRQTSTSRVVAVAGKDRSAVMMSGHSADQLWYWDGKKFATDLASPVPQSVARVNAVVGEMIARPFAALVPPPFCSAKAQPIAIPDHAPVGAGTFGRAAGDSRAFRASPESDAAVLALSAALVRELGLGRGSAPDLLAVGLSATDYVGHTYGTGGQEMCLQLLSLDRDLGDFLARLDNWGLDYEVVVTADHGGLDLPERARLRGVADAARIDPALTPSNVGAEVTKETGISGPILANVGVTGDLYLDEHLKGGERKRALDAAMAAYRRHPQVAAVFSKAEIAAIPVPTGDPTKWSLIERVRASFDIERSGDLYVVLKPNITPIGHAAGSVATHGSPWDYDRRVPILFWRKGMAAANHPEPVETTDIMPTLAATIGIRVDPAAVDGRCLSAVPGAACANR
jgi:hypothetical protein